MRYRTLAHDEWDAQTLYEVADWIEEESRVEQRVALTEWEQGIAATIATLRDLGKKVHEAKQKRISTPQSEAPAPQPSGLVERVGVVHHDAWTKSTKHGRALSEELGTAAALAVADWLDEHFALPGAAGCIRREVEGVERS